MVKVLQIRIVVLYECCIFQITDGREIQTHLKSRALFRVADQARWREARVIVGVAAAEEEIPRGQDSSSLSQNSSTFAAWDHLTQCATQTARQSNNTF